MQRLNFLSKRKQSRARSGFAECEKSRLKAKLLMTLLLLLMAATGAWAQEPATPTYNVSVFDGKLNPTTWTGKAGDGFLCKAYGNVMSLVDEENFATATELTAENTFFMLFDGNTALADASSLLLPATTLTSSCYGSMFDNCTALTAAPKLPATILASACYDSMFYNCTALTAAPRLPATSLATGCYQQMFSDCIKLASVTCLATSNVVKDNISNWLKDAGTEATDPKLYVDPSMTKTDWSNGIFTVTEAPSN